MIPKQYQKKAERKRMIRYRSEQQENLYRQYARIGRKIAKYSLNKKNNELSHQYGWKLITKNGIWKLPIVKKYSGLGLNWQECILAIEGLVDTFSNFEFFSYIVEQVSALYIISKYCTEENKQLYLPSLINGEISCAIFPDKFNFEKILPPSENKNLILYNYLNFKRKLYALLVVKISQPIIDHHKIVSIYSKKVTLRHL